MEPIDRLEQGEQPVEGNVAALDMGALVKEDVKELGGIQALGQVGGKQESGTKRAVQRRRVQTGKLGDGRHSPNVHQMRRLADGIKKSRVPAIASGGDPDGRAAEMPEGAGEHGKGTQRPQNEQDRRKRQGPGGSGGYVSREGWRGGSA